VDAWVNAAMVIRVTRRPRGLARRLHIPIRPRTSEKPAYRLALPACRLTLREAWLPQRFPLFVSDVGRRCSVAGLLRLRGGNRGPCKQRRANCSDGSAAKRNCIFQHRSLLPRYPQASAPLLRPVRTNNVRRPAPFIPRRPVGMQRENLFSSPELLLGMMLASLKLW
jgi:hypothetical protein